MHDHGDWLTCPQVVELLAELDGVLDSTLKTASESTRQVAELLISRGGKRLRPTLLLLAAEFGRGDREILLQSAAALELIHVASLYHDDVMDRAMTRRGGATANSQWGNSLATAGGTLLFARACSLFSSFGDEANRMVSKAAVELCSGQLHEVENAYNIELSIDEHLEILRSKTATLFQLPCRLGAYLAGVTSQGSASLADYAERFGLAFQLTDDALDLKGDVECLGKATLTDIREGIYSFPVLSALQADGVARKRLLSLLRQRLLSEAELREIVGIVQESGTITTALQKARELAEQAKDSLAHLPRGTARDSLERLAEFSVSRSY